MDAEILDVFRRHCVDYNQDADIRGYKVGSREMSPREIYEAVKAGGDTENFELGKAFSKCNSDRIMQSFNDLPRILFDPRPVIGEKNVYRMSRRLCSGVAASLAATAFIRGATYVVYAGLATGAYVVLRHLFD